MRWRGRRGRSTIPRGPSALSRGTDDGRSGQSNRRRAKGAGAPGIVAGARRRPALSRAKAAGSPCRSTGSRPAAALSRAPSTIPGRPSSRPRRPSALSRGRATVARAPSTMPRSRSTMTEGRSRITEGRSTIASGVVARRRVVGGRHDGLPLQRPSDLQCARPDRRFAWTPCRTRKLPNLAHVRFRQALEMTRLRARRGPACRLLFHGNLWWFERARQSCATASRGGSWGACSRRSPVWVRLARRGRRHRPGTSRGRATSSSRRPIFVTRADLPRRSKFKAAHASPDNPVTTFEVARAAEALERLVQGFPRRLRFDRPASSAARRDGARDPGPARRSEGRR